MEHQCLGCSAKLPPPFLDLGRMPLANSCVPLERAALAEAAFPLAVAYCATCHLVQLTHIVPPDQLFSDYLYLSSYSDTVVAHGRRMAESLMERLSIDSRSQVIEIASNDGYLLENFRRRSIAVLGVEPARNIAAVAEQRGIPTLNRFFGPEIVPWLLANFGAADLIIGNNVLAHVPAVNGFLGAVRDCLKPNGVAVFEFPYLAELLEHCEFDTIYHEHVFYFSLTAIDILVRRAGLQLIDVERKAIHGGSLRIFLARQTWRGVNPNVSRMLAAEREQGLTGPDRYAGFSHQVREVRRGLLDLLGGLRQDGKTVAAYGAPAKGNTLLNYCGIGCGTIDFTVDRSPYKQGKLLPGSRIPVLAPEELLQRMPNYAVILPWNIAPEITAQQETFVDRGGRFIIPIPEAHILPARPLPLTPGKSTVNRVGREAPACRAADPEGL
jgi:SAM-dependent methyltransferase